jgi:hypothetical protein
MNINVEKCRYFNGHQTACCLMLDDLVPAAVSIDGTLGPHNDWGFLMDGEGSLFSYFKRFLLDKFPEIRGTFFLPLESHREIARDRGYQVFARPIDGDFVAFTRRFAPRFELGFHGIRHAFMEGEAPCFEFAGLMPEQFAGMKAIIDDYAAMGIRFSGGKFPGYRFNAAAIGFFSLMGYYWLASGCGMINRRSAANRLGIIVDTAIVDVPSNISGDAFNSRMNRGGPFRTLVRNISRPGAFFKPEEHLDYLYSRGLPITIQEHFQNQGSDGKRQKPNVYDDLPSLERIFGLLRPRDVWHATCSEIAAYYDSFLHTAVIARNGSGFELRYSGPRPSGSLSVAADVPVIIETATRKRISGLRKKDRFIFNNLAAGKTYSCP